MFLILFSQQFLFLFNQVACDEEGLALDGIERRLVRQRRSVLGGFRRNSGDGRKIRSVRRRLSVDDVDVQGRVRNADGRKSADRQDALAGKDYIQNF